MSHHELVNPTVLKATDDGDYLHWSILPTKITHVRKQNRIIRVSLQSRLACRATGDTNNTIRSFSSIHFICPPAPRRTCPQVFFNIWPVRRRRVRSGTFFPVSHCLSAPWGFTVRAHFRSEETNAYLLQIVFIFCNFSF